LEKLLPRIDWDPFFSTWSLRGTYPNRGYPKIFNDAAVGIEAKKLFDDAQKLLREIVSKKLLIARGVIAFYPANSIGEDIELYEDESKSNVVGKFFGLRQQSEKEGNDATYSALGDFIATKSSGITDYMGVFAVSTGFGLNELVKKFESDYDDYSAIMAKALADRLAESFAETLHEEVRKIYWGYSASEAFTTQELLRVKYQGIRPAPGYPMQPDHTEKITIWNLLKVKENTGIELTESLAMLPGASVSGLYLGNKDSKYFAVGKITLDQVTDYALRKGMPLKEIEKWLSPSLAYNIV